MGKPFEYFRDLLEVDSSKYSKFKIGKTGQEIRERFQTEYQDEYDDIRSLALSEDSALIDCLEKFLIAYFQNDPKCQNHQIGGGEMAQSKVYRIYVVFVLKK